MKLKTKLSILKVVSFVMKLLMCVSGIFALIEGWTLTGYFSPGHEQPTLAQQNAIYLFPICAIGFVAFLIVNNIIKKKIEDIEFRQLE